MKKFTWEEFKGNKKMVVHCKTEKEAKDFCKMMHEHGMKWGDGSSYLCITGFLVYEDGTCYGGDGSFSGCAYYSALGYHIYEYSDIVEDIKKKENIKERL